MRRLVSSLTLGLALLCASLAWSAFSTRSTFLDAKRSERIAEALVAEPVVRDAVAKGLGDALQRALPPGTPITAAEVEAATRSALDDPRALAALKAAMVGAHQRLLGDTDGPVTLDARALADSGRDALIAARPDLAGALPAVPDLSVELPTENLPELGGLRGPLGLAAGLGTLAFAVLLAVSFLIASDRPRVLSRAGRWGVGAGLWWAALGYVVPRLAADYGGPRFAILGSLGKALSAPLVGPAVALFIVGVGAMVAARFWRLALARTPGPLSPPGPDPRAPYATPPRQPQPHAQPHAQPQAQPLQPGGNTWVA